MFDEKSSRRRTCIWQRPDWPQWRLDVAAPLAKAHRAQGHLAGRMGELGLAQRDLATLQALTPEVITTSAIEGEAQASTGKPLASFECGLYAVVRAALNR